MQSTEYSIYNMLCTVHLHPNKHAYWPNLSVQILKVIKYFLFLFFIIIIIIIITYFCFLSSYIRVDGFIIAWVVWWAWMWSDMATEALQPTASRQKRM